LDDFAFNAVSLPLWMSMLNALTLPARSPSNEEISLTA